MLLGCTACLIMQQGHTAIQLKVRPDVPNLRRQRSFWVALPQESWQHLEPESAPGAFVPSERGVQAWGAEEAQRTHFKNHSSRGFSYATTPPAVGPASLIFPHDPPVSYGRAPGPGTYDLQAALSLHRKVEARFESQSAAFHPPTAPPRPRRVPGAVKLSAPQPGALLVADVGAQEVDGAAAGARAQPGPGPGEYESHVAKVAIDPARGATAPFVSKVRPAPPPRVAATSLASRRIPPLTPRDVLI